MSKKRVQPTDAMVDDAESTSTLIGTDDRSALSAILSVALNHPDAPGLFECDHTDYVHVDAAATRVEAAREQGWDDAADWLDSRACLNAAHNLRAANPYRTARDLPEDPGAVIVAADGLDGIKAVRDSDEWGAAEAVLGADGQWHGVWREDLGQGVFGSVPPEWITPGTWKVADK